MEYSQLDGTQYLDPTTGQYYTQQTYMPPVQNNGYFGFGSNGGGIAGNYNNSSQHPALMDGRNYYAPPQAIRKNTGDVSQVWKMLQNKQPYQYNVPSIASMFPSMAMPTMNNYQPTQYSGNAGQFLGGLLGSSPMAMNNAAPMANSSGAGRFA